MFSDNKKISGRQLFRLFLFCFTGLGSLILPAWLARLAGSAGWLCIVTGGCLGILYLVYLARLLERLDTDLMSWLREQASGAARVIISGFLCVHCVFTASACLGIFAEVMRENLVGSEKFGIVMLVLLAIAGYAVEGGIESWVRIYEMLFWFVFLPLVLMLMAGAWNMDTIYLAREGRVELGNIMEGSFLVFLFLELSFWMLFFPGYVRGRDRKRITVRCVAAALACTVVFLVVTYQIVLGNFGSGALQRLPYPVVTLMSTIQVSGKFIKRLDALMLGVWFFSLFALLTLLLFFAEKMARLFVGDMPVGTDEKRRRYLFAVLAVVGLLTLLGYRASVLEEVYRFYIWYVGAPLLILLPIAISALGVKNER